MKYIYIIYIVIINTWAQAVGFPLLLNVLESQVGEYSTVCLSHRIPNPVKCIQATVFWSL